ncbi:phage head closure protein [Pseudalkalibacillus caeni]|uniref:Head-tail adaptor protein n=1 Tax=Exobacillus caeni TaxID=2574798 RepID=A0A5R9F414_9BACL|nr:phage head closure protein [Pseudalkalibacillus caeni]TLS37741.1 head-tail adaptor protein [Pseudalkalibacillus caeni]
MKSYRETFNDGFLQYGHNSVQRSANGKRIGESFLAEGKLAFKEMSARESDFELAGTMGSSLDLKVKTRFPPSFRNIKKSGLKVVIESVEYDVIKADVDRNNNYLYFYLQEVGDIT